MECDSASGTGSIKEQTMTINMPTLFRRSILRKLSLALFVLSAASSALAQTETGTSGNWWNPSPDGIRESGKLSELAAKKKVYVLTSFTDARTITEPSPTRIGDIQRAVLEALSVYKDLHVVSVPSQADFAIRVLATVTTDTGDRLPNLSLALDPSTAVAVEVMVLIPGSKRPDGTSRSRVVWESSIANAQVEAQAATRSTVDGFLWELSKQKERAATKSK
jgi:hypothetical protein